MNVAANLDVSELPDEGFGTSSTPWWGTLGFMAAESATLLLSAATLLYLTKNLDAWPPPGVLLPGLLAPTLNLALMLASLLPAAWLYRAAHRMDARAITRLLVLGTVIELVLVAVRVWEFGSLGVRWDSNAWGSAVWFTLGFHTLLLATDLVETAVFGAIFLRGRIEKKHFADVADVAFYWFFVVFAWIPLYLLIFIAPRVS